MKERKYNGQIILIGKIRNKQWEIIQEKCMSIIESASLLELADNLEAFINYSKSIPDTGGALKELQHTIYNWHIASFWDTKLLRKASSQKENILQYLHSIWPQKGNYRSKIKYLECAINEIRQV